MTIVIITVVVIITGYEMTWLRRHVLKSLCIIDKLISYIIDQLISYIIDKLRVRMRHFIANEHEKIDDNNEKGRKLDKTNEYVTMKDIDQPGQ